MEMVFGFVQTDFREKLSCGIKCPTYLLRGPWDPYLNLLKNHKVWCKESFENQLSVSKIKMTYVSMGQKKVNGLIDFIFSRSHHSRTSLRSSQSESEILRPAWFWIAVSSWKVILIEGNSGLHCKSTPNVWSQRNVILSLAFMLN